MSDSSTIHVPVEPEMRKKFTVKAKQLGFDSAQAYLRVMIKAAVDGRRIELDADDWGEPSAAAVKRLNRATEEALRGENISGPFDTVEEFSETQQQGEEELAREVGPKYALLICTLELDESVVSAIGLDRPSEAYDGMTLEEAQAEKSRMSVAVYPHIKSVWEEEGDVRFVVISGKDVFKSYDDPVNFDGRTFAELIPTKFLMIHRPVAQNSPISVAS